MYIKNNYTNPCNILWSANAISNAGPPLGTLRANTFWSSLRITACSCPCCARRCPVPRRRCVPIPTPAHRKWPAATRGSAAVCTPGVPTSKSSWRLQPTEIHAVNIDRARTASTLGVGPFYLCLLRKSHRVPWPCTMPISNLWSSAICVFSSPR